jgi:hypothetical protein
MKAPLKGHIAGMGRKTACGIPISRNLIVFDLSKAGYKMADCKRCKAVVGKILGK